MAELSTKKYSKRVIFPSGKQRVFLEQVSKRFSLKKLASLSGVSVRSLTDWKREKFSISLFALRKICRELNISLPRDIRIESSFWYTQIGSHKGGVAVYKKYGSVGGDVEYRKQKWREWWNNTGKFKECFIGSRLKTYFPLKSSRLAEFVGILLGDGGITKRQISITLHKYDDQDFSIYVKSLIKQLFHVTPSLYKRRGENIVSIVVSRSELVQWLNSIGLLTGSKVKQQVDIPIWIKESASFTKACIRGLFDTDGCFYVDKHPYRKKVYENCCMNFTNRSLPILSFFKRGLDQLGFHPTQRTKFSIFLRKEKEILKYFQIIGTSNKKHCKKFQNYFKNKHGEVPKRS